MFSLFIQILYRYFLVLSIVPVVLLNPPSSSDVASFDSVAHIISSWLTGFSFTVIIFSELIPLRLQPVADVDPIVHVE
jgi:preprotein translocase subunit SecG